MVDMSVKIGSVTLKNPIMPASGAFSTDLAQVMDVNRLGALVCKTVSRGHRDGNPPPRVAEVEGGMINSIGLPTKGLAYFLDHQIPDYKRFTPPLVANITATTAEDFEAMARDVDLPEVDVIEMNISCPTREPGGGNFALHEDHTYEIVRRVRAATKKPLWAKLSPNAGRSTWSRWRRKRPAPMRSPSPTRCWASRSTPRRSGPRSATATAGCRAPASSRSFCAWCTSARRW